MSARNLALAAAVVLAASVASRGQTPARDIDVEDFSVPDGYVVEPVVTNLSVPTTAIFHGDDLLIAESGTKNTAKPRVLRVKRDGTVEVVASEGLLPPVTGLLVVGDTLYVSHRTKVSAVGAGGALRDIVTDLPSFGDHQNNQIVLGPDGKIYMGQGTVTNSGVVGLDNDVFGWLEQQPAGHEVPCEDIVVTGETFETDNPLTDDDGDKARTGAYKPFGTAAADGETIPGNPKCGGSIARFGPDGSGYEVVAWGLRNPFGLTFDGGGRLWATYHGADVRGSRNVFGDPDYVVQVEKGQWYGWPDFFDGEPVTKSRFDPLEKAGAKFLLKRHPPLAKAFATIRPHSGACGIKFSPGGAFGYAGDAFVALYGTFAPVTTGLDLAPAGFSVARLDMKTRKVEEFVKNDLPGPAYLNHQDGFNRPVDVVFAADASLYVVDWGASTVDKEGLKVVPRSGVVWRIRPASLPARAPNGPVAVEAASVSVPKDQIEPEVPNKAATYKAVGPTLAVIGAGVVLLLLALVWLWRRRRRPPANP